jgi:hypothetical protein
LGIAHGNRIYANWSSPHWEDEKFFSYIETKIDNPTDCFTKRSYWQGLYRPLSTNLYYWVSSSWFGNRIGVHHAIGVALIFLNAFLLYLLCTFFFPGASAMVPPLILVSRTATAENLLHSCEVQTTLSTLFCMLFLVGFLWGRRRDSRMLELWSLVPLFLAFLSKEAAVVAAPIAIVYGMLFEPRAHLRRYLPMVLATISFWTFYGVFLRPLCEPLPDSKVFVFTTSGSVISQNYGAYFFDFFNCLNVPKGLAAESTRVGRLEHPGVLSACFFIAVLSLSMVLIRALRRGPLRTTALFTAAFGLCAFFIALAPYALLEKRNYMRYGYFGYFGLAVAVTALAKAAIEFGRRVAAWTSTVRTIQDGRIEEDRALPSGATNKHFLHFSVRTTDTLAEPIMGLKSPEPESTVPK